MTSRILADFAKEVKEFNDDNTTTEGYHRPAISNLFRSLGSGIRARNEPGRIECGSPDFIVTRNGNVVGHIEHKKIGVDLQNMKGSNKEQQERYRKALPNLIYTNCLEWDFYREGRLDVSLSLGVDNKELERQLEAFIDHKPFPISDPEILARKMAGKTTLLKVALQKKLIRDGERGEIWSHYKAFSESIMIGKSIDEFAELYAETITYGMFAARMNVSDDKEFTRAVARKSLSKNNPFLRRLFRHIYSEDLDKDIDWIVDDLVSLLSVCEVNNLMKRFMKVSGREDPFLHFFETFLEAYDPERRRDKGVYYTPQQAVNFIVRATDKVLKEELEIRDGLADISTIPGKKYENGKPMHKVRVLDPATGTGTFLVETVRQIAPIIKKRAKSAWTKYVETHLIPRLHGFEILMAPYAMCFAKIDMVLKALGYVPSEDPSRIEVYLGDALDLGMKQPDLTGLEWMTDEAKFANLIKDGDKPVMCVIGNPPYSTQASTPEKGSIIEALLEDYKTEPGKEGKIKGKTKGHLNDLYLQFMRLSSYLVEKREEGVIGLITSNSYLDRKTFRAVRFHLLKTFDKIWIVNLHGDSGIGEKCPDGSPDFNIFNIQKGVAIIIGVKVKNENSADADMAVTRYIDLWGSREFKLKWLEEMTLSAPDFEIIDPVSAPDFLMINIDNSSRHVYEDGFRLDEMIPLPKNRSGIVTSKDEFSFGMSREELRARMEKLRRKEDKDAIVFLKSFLKNPKKADNPNLLSSIRSEIGDIDDNLFEIVSYRPFDKRWVYYTGKNEGLIYRCSFDAMKPMKIKGNISIAVPNGFNPVGDYCHAFCHEGICDYTLLSSKTREGCRVFPLLSEKDGIVWEDGKRYNFNSELFERIVDEAGFAPRGGGASPRDAFNYIYGVLHCPKYRSVYKQYLSLDFPRIPWPSSSEEFWDVSKKGRILLELHLMKLEVANTTLHQLDGKGDNNVAVQGMPKFVDGKVWINSDQCFEDVPAHVWNFRIGSYRPAQDWLKKRKGMILEYEDIVHYQSVLNILSETHRIMQSIEMNLPSCHV